MNPERFQEVDTSFREVWKKNELTKWINYKRHACNVWVKNIDKSRYVVIHYCNLSRFFLTQTLVELTVKLIPMKCKLILEHEAKQKWLCHWRSVVLETKLSSLNFSQKMNQWILFYILMTGRSKVYFQVFPSHQERKQILLIIFGKSYSLTIFVSRSTDL